ncbi:hypothetical protein [Ensifer sp. ENS01]
MKAMAAAAKNIDAMFKGTLPYDAKAFKPPPKPFEPIQANA